MQYLSVSFLLRLGPSSKMYQVPELSVICYLRHRAPKLPMAVASFTTSACPFLIDVNYVVYRTYSIHKYCRKFDATLIKTINVLGFIWISAISSQRIKHIL